MSLAKILEEIKAVQPFAEENVEQGALETLTARRGRKNQAIETLIRLKRSYTRELRSTAAFIIVIGDKRNEFTSLAVENNGCFTTDPDLYFSDLISRIPPALYMGKESVSNIFDILGRHIEDKAHTLDIYEYPQLIFKQEYHQHIGNREDFLALVKRAVTEQIGGEIVGIQAASSLTDTAIKRENTAKFTPILLPTGDERFALTVANDLVRLNSRVFVVGAGTTEKKLKSARTVTVAEPTEENVKKALKKISDSLKKLVA